METEENNSSEEIKSEESKLIHHICSQTNIFLKSQQLDEPELSYSEKYTIVEGILNNSHSTFLARFNEYLTIPDHIKFFDLQDYDDIDYDTKYYYLDKIRKSQSNKEKAVRNRRFLAMQKMIEENSYFSEIEMMNREPLLYDNLVGQHLTEQEKKARDKCKTDTTFLNILMNGIDKNYASELLKRQQEEDENQDTTTDLEEEEAKMPKRHWGSFEDVNQEEDQSKHNKMPKFITSDERNMLKDEFKSIMYSRFIDGKETDFDYTKIDNSSEFDDLDQIEQDEQDKYFDSEDEGMM